MLKLLPDALQRLSRRLASDPVEQRIKAMQIVQELALGEALRPALEHAVHHPNPRVRSKAVGVLAQTPDAPRTCWWTRR